MFNKHHLIDAICPTLACFHHLDLCTEWMTENFNFGHMFRNLQNMPTGKTYRKCIGSISWKISTKKGLQTLFWNKPSTSSTFLPPFIVRPQSENGFSIEIQAFGLNFFTFWNTSMLRIYIGKILLEQKWRYKISTL